MATSQELTGFDKAEADLQDFMIKLLQSMHSYLLKAKDREPMYAKYLRVARAMEISEDKLPPHITEIRKARRLSKIQSPSQEVAGEAGYPKTGSGKMWSAEHRAKFEATQARKRQERDQHPDQGS